MHLQIVALQSLLDQPTNKRRNIDLAAAARGPVSNFNEDLGVVDLPFLIFSYAHVDKVLDGSIGCRLPRILIDTAAASSLVMMVISMAGIFSWLLASEEIPQMVTAQIRRATTNKVLILTS
jgi:TRAP-type C4-dicarboxylate transport system substrate-binding protein